MYARRALSAERSIEYDEPELAGREREREREATRGSSGWMKKRFAWSSSLLSRISSGPRPCDASTNTRDMVARPKSFFGLFGCAIQSRVGTMPEHGDKNLIAAKLTSELQEVAARSLEQGLVQTTGSSDSFWLSPPPLTAWRFWFQSQVATECTELDCWPIAAGSDICFHLYQAILHANPGRSLQQLAPCVCAISLSCKMMRFGTPPFFPHILLSPTSPIRVRAA